MMKTRLAVVALISLALGLPAFGEIYKEYISRSLR